MIKWEAKLGYACGWPAARHLKKERKIARQARWGIWAATLILLLSLGCSSGGGTRGPSQDGGGASVGSQAGKAKTEGKPAYRWVFRTTREPTITAGGIFVDSGVDLRKLAERLKADFEDSKIVSLKIYDDPAALADQQGRDFGWIAWYSKNVQTGVHKLQIAAKEGRKAELLEY